MTKASAKLATLILAGIPALTCLPGLAQSAVTPDGGCVQNKGTYQCNWSSFKLAFDRAHTVALETQPIDRSTGRQVGTLLDELGKTRLEGQTADLTMLVIPMDPSGMNLGPADHDLATLRIYAPREGTARGILLWAETLRGQGDRPWPAQVHALLMQFQDRFSKR